MYYRLLILFALLMVAQTALAQDGALPAAACQSLVDDALAEARAACDDVAPNQVCFGHGPVEVALNDSGVPSFAAAGDTLSLDTVFSLRLGGFQAASGEWGLASLRVQGDEAGHDVLLMLSGDVEMRNTCSALLQQEVQLTHETELRAGPGSDFASVALLPEGTRLHVNACNCTGHWLRAIQADGQTGWIWKGSVDAFEGAEALPVVVLDSPVYAPMQSFCLRSESLEPSCPQAPANGVLIQTSSETGEAHLQINQVELGLTSTAFVQSQVGRQLTVSVLDGTGSVTLDGLTLAVPRGVRAVVPLNDDNRPAGPARLEVFTADDVAAVPVDLLPRPVALADALADTLPVITGVEPCLVLSDQAATNCRVHFVNAGAQAIVALDAQFVSAPEGAWESGVHPAPALLEGDATSGVVSWDATCSVGSTVFIGPVVWRLTLTDAEGQQSVPFEASFNCQ